MTDTLEMEGTVMLNCIANFVWSHDLYMYNYSLFNLCNDLKEISKIEFLVYSSSHLFEKFVFCFGEIC